MDELVEDTVLWIFDDEGKEEKEVGDSGNQVEMRGQVATNVECSGPSLVFLEVGFVENVVDDCAFAIDEL